MLRSVAGPCESFQTHSPLLSSWSCVLWLQQKSIQHPSSIAPAHLCRITASSMDYGTETASRPTFLPLKHFIFKLPFNSYLLDSNWLQFCPWVRRDMLCACSFHCLPPFSPPLDFLSRGLALPITPLPSVSFSGATARKEHHESCADDERSLTDCAGLCTWLPAEALLCPLNLALSSSLTVSSS